MIRRENRRNRKDFEFIKPQARVLVKPEVFESLLACGQLPKNPDPQILNICGNSMHIQMIKTTEQIVEDYVQMYTFGTIRTIPFYN